ncbi:MAG TPA: hypothetical protein VL053_18445 [Arachidicoccus sp.]|nr:hypothetical protein [Arachidicoccus sp.]
MDDPQIGRFWQIDPLADKYVYNFTYAFSENKVTSHIELEGLESKSIADGAWREVESGFQHLANWVDSTFSFGSKTTVETPIEPMTDNISNNLSVENTTSISTNLSSFMGYGILNYSNDGYNGSTFKSTNESSISVDTKTNIKTSLGNGTLSRTIDDSVNVKLSRSASIKTKSGLSMGVSASGTSDGSNKVGGNVSISSENSKGKLGLNVCTNKTYQMLQPI